MRPFLITTCTGRKKIAPLPALHASHLPVGDQPAVLREWTKRLEVQPREATADNVYCGRGFSEMLSASKANGAELWVISAGLGLIPVQQRIPSYNLTISASSPDSIQTRIAPEHGFTSPCWWSALNLALNGTTTALADIIKTNTDGFFIFALSRPYAEMIVEDLLSLPATHHHRIRLIGLRPPLCMPEPLKPLCMPYDERFDGPDNVAVGTRSDFPQRTARHFLEEILPVCKDGTPSRHAELVASFLQEKRLRPLVKRTRKNEDEIKAIILQQWAQAKGSSAKMLRILRDGVNVACEQKRFAQLFKEVKAEKNDAA